MKVYVLHIEWEGGYAAFADLNEAIAAAEDGGAIDYIEEWELGDAQWWHDRPTVWRRHIER